MAKKITIKIKNPFVKMLLSRAKWFPEFVVFAFAFFTRFIRLGIPNTYMFDEVYHAFTAGQMFKGNPAAWEWWNTPPKGFAYEWTHPPLTKEFMVAAISIFGDQPFAWRFFSALFGFGGIVLTYLIAYKLFKNRLVALFAALAMSMDGLFLVMSRIGMNDMYFVFFALLAFFLFLNDRKILMGLALGLSIASEWTGFFAIGILGLIYLSKLLINLRDKKLTNRKFVKGLLASIFFFGVIPLLVYVSVYLPFFTGHHTPPGEQPSPFNINTFIGLQEEMWWYHTNLKATHPYQSVPIQWVLDLRPVWLYVNYQGDMIANIYTLGNPLFMWFGVVCIIFLIFEFIRKRKLSIGIVLLSYFGFFLPWQISPRIMFHYHYLPAVPFLAIATGYVLHKIFLQRSGRLFVSVFFVLLFVLFVYFFPLWTAIHVPRCVTPSNNCFSWYDSYFWFPSWK